MFLKDDENKNATLYCSCGCENGIIIRAEKANENEPCCTLSFVNDIWYTSQNTGWDIFKEKCKRIWAILRNKEYYYFYITIRSKELESFKKFIAEM